MEFGPSRHSMSKLRVFDNDRSTYSLGTLQLDVVADEETLSNNSPGTKSRSFKNIGKGGFASIFIGSVRKRSEELFLGHPDYQLLGYYHDALMAVHSSRTDTIALKKQVSTDMLVKVAVKRIEVVAEYEILREASNLRVLRGRRNFITIYGPTKSRDLDCLCLVMDYVHGCNLNQFLRSRGRDVFRQDLDEERARMCKLWESNEVLWWIEKLKLFREVVIALIVCHSQNVYHGDLKGANILLDETLVPKIVDFGLSFRSTDISYLQELRGSLFWVAPEVVSPPEVGTIHESKVVSNPYPSDVYSLGMVLAEMMLDGEIPESFTQTAFFIADKWLEGCPISLDHVSSQDSTFTERILSRLKSLIDGCCKAERDDRMPLQKCLSEVNAVFSELYSFCSPIQCSVLYVKTDHDFTGTRAYRDMMLRFKERFPDVSECMIMSPSWNMVMDVEENLLVHYFCKLDYVEGVQYIVEMSTWDFQSERDIPYMSLLCVREESLNTLQYLAASWPDTMKRQLLLLHKACLCNNPEIFRFLLVDIGIDFDTWEVFIDQKMKPVDYTWEVQRGLKPEDDIRYVKPIHKLAALGRTEMVSMILENCGVEFPDYVNTTMPVGLDDTPLYCAIRGGDHVETVRFLMDRGGSISVDRIRAQFFYDPSWSLGREEILPTLLFLIRHEYDNDRKKIKDYLFSRQLQGLIDPISLTAHTRQLQHAPDPEHSSDVRALCASDERYLDLAKPYVRRILSAFETGVSEEMISLHFQIEFPWALAEECCRKGYLGILQFLEDCGLDLNLYKEMSNAVGNRINPLLNQAAFFGHVDVARYLVERGHSVNSKFLLFGSTTPLQRACESPTLMHKKEMVAFLLNAGADPNYRDEFGYTAMDRASGSDSYGRELVRLLLEAGFDCGLKDRWGEDYLDHIARIGILPAC